MINYAIWAWPFKPRRHAALIVFETDELYSFYMRCAATGYDVVAHHRQQAGIASALAVHIAATSWALRGWCAEPEAEEQEMKTEKSIPGKPYYGCRRAMRTVPQRSDYWLYTYHISWNIADISRQVQNTKIKCWQYWMNFSKILVLGQLAATFSERIDESTCFAKFTSRFSGM